MFFLFNNLRSLQSIDIMNLRSTFFPYRTFMMLAFFVILFSCGTPATQITGSWKDPAASSYKDFFVAVLVKNQQARQQLEGDIASRLTRAHVKVTRSLEVFPHTEK